MLLVKLGYCIQLNLYLSICTKLNSKWINELKMKSNTKNFIEEDVGDLLELIDTGKNFLNSTPITLALRSTMGLKASVWQRKPTLSSGGSQTT